MRKTILILTILLFAVPAFAAPKYWAFCDTGTNECPGGKQRGATAPAHPDYAAFEINATMYALPSHYLKHAGGVVEEKTPTEIANSQVEINKVDREARRQRIITRLSGLSDAQIDTYIDSNVIDLASATAYLKRLTKVVRDLAINVNGGRQ